LLDQKAAAAIGARIPGDGELIGLRPNALVLDVAGRLTGQVVLVTPAPGGLLLTVRVRDVGLIQAIGPVDRVVAIGDTVGLRLDPAATATVPASEDGPRAAGLSKAEMARRPVIVG